jgi:hypothetical protein
MGATGCDPSTVAARRPALGSLDDGTSYFAPLGEVPYDPDEDRVQCHLCGEWFRVVGGLHLRRTHAWTISQYRKAFGLLKHEPTCSKGVSEKLRKHTRARIAAGELTAAGPVPQATGKRRARSAAVAVARGCPTRSGRRVVPRVERRTRCVLNRGQVRTAVVVAMP